jgi:hypothetical protein
MASYLLLINDNEADYDAADDATRRALDEAHEVFNRDHQDIVVESAHLQPTSTAKVVREDGRGGFLTTGGAYAGTDEALGGYYVIEVPDLDLALEVAKRMPFFGKAGEAAVEVRPRY